MTRPYRFERRCSYLNSIFFRVTTPAGESFEAELRLRLGDYEASIYNGGAAAYERACAPLVGMLQVCRPIPAHLLGAFNAWIQDEHDASLATLRAAPERYGPESDWAESVGSATLARGCYWLGADGWQLERAA